MDGWVGGLMGGGGRTKRQLQPQGDGPSQGSQDLHAHRLRRPGAPGVTGVPRGCEELCCDAPVGH